MRSSHRLSLAALPLIGGCTFGTVVYTCTCDGSVDVDTAACADVEMSCTTYAEEGWQLVNGRLNECIDAAIAAGGTTATCDCAFDVPATCRPTGVND